MSGAFMQLLLSTSSWRPSRNLPVTVFGSGIKWGKEGILPGLSGPVSGIDNEEGRIASIFLLIRTSHLKSTCSSMHRVMANWRPNLMQAYFNRLERVVVGHPEETRRIAEEYSKTYVRLTKYVTTDTLTCRGEVTTSSVNVDVWSGKRRS